MNSNNYVASYNIAMTWSDKTSLIAANYTFILWYNI